jgi:WD40 repeat protein
VTPDGKIVIAGGQDSILRVWDGSGGKVIAAFAPPNH